MDWLDILFYVIMAVYGIAIIVMAPCVLKLMIKERKKCKKREEEER